MFDLVVCAMLLVIPLQWYSVYLLKKKKNLSRHRSLQLLLGGLLLATVVIFELDVRLYDWTPLAEPSPYYNTLLFPFLYFHVIFAVATTLSWAITIYGAVKVYSKDLRFRHEYSGIHKKLGWTSVFLINLTALTGWIFYYLAFVAE